jgi:hypothetical protein
MNKQSTHGGPRKGAGRPKGKKNANAKGRTAVTKSVSMPEGDWRFIDMQRGRLSRGKFLINLVRPFLALVSSKL